VATFTLTSDAFANNALIPSEYSCDGKSSSPPLKWTGAPPAAKAFALVMHDPDAPRAGGVTHWLVYDLPANAAGLDAGASPGGTLPASAKQGANSAGRNQYTGPCPPKGGPAHHYNFRLYALDAPLNLEAGKSKDDVEKAVEGHVLAQADFTGLFAH
jgi:Raf kinase inhibitor-like YbhB/YbcL family protein